MASDRSIAKLALMFSVLACVVGGLAIMQNSGEVDVFGKLKSMGKEATKVFQKAKEKVEKKSYGGDDGGAGPDIFESEVPELFRGGEASSEPDYGDPSFSPLKRIKEQIDKIEAMIRNADGRVPETVDKLKQDVERLRNYTAERGGPMMERITEGLTEARDRIGNDSASAARKLRELSESIVSQLKKRATDAKKKMPALPSDGAGESPE